VGAIKAGAGPIEEKGKPAQVQLRFTPGAKDLDNIFLLCRYAPTSASGCR
jgi:hypothetical protein